MDNDLMDIDGNPDRDGAPLPPAEPTSDGDGDGDGDGDLPARDSENPEIDPSLSPNPIYILLHHIPDPFQTSTRKANSPTHSFAGFDWRLLIFPMGNETPDESMSLYLECCGPTVDLDPPNPSPRDPAPIHDPDAQLNPKIVQTNETQPLPKIRPFVAWRRAVHFKLLVINQKDATDAGIPLVGTTVLEGQHSGPRVMGSVAERLVGLQNNFGKSADHGFSDSETDWGFKDFVTHDVLRRDGFVGNETGLVVAVQIELVDHSVAHDTSFFPPVDTRKETGYVGLKNQGATCYMNSLLQTLYSLGEFRRAVYRMPLPSRTESQQDGLVPPEPNGGIQPRETSLALQKLFYELQYSDTVVKTKKLTESFGWDTSDAFTQHDVQELNRILCDHLEERMKANGSGERNTISLLFEGKILNYIECLHVRFESKQEESFYDLSLNVKGCRTLYESFGKYTEVETLDGDNKYRADGFSELQEARKGVRFLKLPPVLQLHLKRFEYDFTREMMVKINDRFEFDTEIDLSDFVQDSDGTDVYLLNSVLVHVGDVHGGHYYAFIRSDTSRDEWLKFDDEMVEKATVESAVNDSFGMSLERRSEQDDFQLSGLGGSQTPPYPPRNRTQAKRFSNAYMLQYVRKRDANGIFGDADDKDIPQKLRERIDEEKEEEEQRRKDRTEQHLYILVAIATDDDLHGHHGPDLVEWDKPTRKRVKRTTTLAELRSLVRADDCRIWKCSQRRNTSIRPDGLLVDGKEQRCISDGETDISAESMRLYDDVREIKLYVEPLRQGENQALEVGEMILFIKEYNPAAIPPLRYIRKCIVHRSDRSSRLLEFIANTLKLPAAKIANLFEEVSQDTLTSLDLSKTFAELNMTDGGDIVVFQQSDNETGYVGLVAGRDLSLAPDYYAYLERRVSIEFRERNNPSGSGFSLELLESDEQELIRQALVAKIGSGACAANIRLFGADIGGDYPKTDAFGVSEPISLNTMLREGIRFPFPQKVLWYEVCHYEVKAVDKLTDFRVSWCPDAGAITYPWRAEVAPWTVQGIKLPSATKFSVFVPNGSLYSAIFVEVRRILDLPAEFPLRAIEIKANTITRTFPASASVSDSLESNMDIRCEPDVGEGNLLTVVHLPREKGRNRPADIKSAFGSPFILKVDRNGEELGTLRTRIMNFLRVSPDEFCSWKVATLRGSVLEVGYIEDEASLIEPTGGLILALEHRNEYPIPVGRRFMPASKPLVIRPQP